MDTEFLNGIATGTINEDAALERLLSLWLELRTNTLILTPEQTLSRTFEASDEMAVAAYLMVMRQISLCEDWHIQVRIEKHGIVETGSSVGGKCRWRFDHGLHIWRHFASTLAMESEKGKASAARMVRIQARDTAEIIRNGISSQLNQQQTILGSLKFNGFA